MTPIPEQHHDDIVAVYTAHGTTVAATWAGVSHDAVRSIARRAGIPRHDRHTSLTINRALQPDCPCPRCAKKPRPGRLTPSAVNQLLGVEANTDTTWKADAACRGSDPALFYLDCGEDSSQAKALCHQCPVRQQCLEEALDTPWGEDHGIWGATTRLERKKLRAARNRDRQVQALKRTA